MARVSLPERIAREVADRTGVFIAVEEDGDTLRLTGRVDSEEARLAAEQVASDVAPRRQIANDLDVDQTLPQTPGGRLSGDPSEADLPDTVDEIRDMGGDVNPDFTDQTLLSDPMAAVGPSSSADDPMQEGNEAYFAPTDPVVKGNEHGELEVLGGFSPTSMDDTSAEPSAMDQVPGDEALEDAVRRELREDALTTDLNLRVLVRGGVVHLRGTVAGIEDAENAQEVATRVPGVVEAVDETEVAAERGR
jgi:osmotically-inducible protein OsmY